MTANGSALVGARVLVTGAARGLGLAITRDLADRGARVAAVDVDEEGVDDLRGLNGVTGIQCDVSDADAVDAAFVRAEAELGGLDGVVSNAAIVDVTRAKARDLDPAEFDRVMAVNARGTWLVCRRALATLSG
ncbi:MAG: SDR family oxidoreductase, partial [bacterium]